MAAQEIVKAVRMAISAAMVLLPVWREQLSRIRGWPERKSLDCQSSGSMPAPLANCTGSRAIAKSRIKLVALMPTSRFLHECLGHGYLCLWIRGQGSKHQFAQGREIAASIHFYLALLAVLRHHGFRVEDQ